MDQLPESSAAEAAALALVRGGGKSMLGNRPLALTIGALLTIGCFSGTAVGESKPPPSRPIAFVNGEPISRSDYDAAASRVPELATTAVVSGNRAALQKQLIELLVDDLLLRQFLRKYAPAPEPKLVQQRVRDLEQKLHAKGRTLEEYCRENNQSRAQIEASIGAAIQWNDYAAKRITEAELRRCYEANRDLFDGVMLRASHIFLAVPPDSAAASREATVERLRQIRREIESGMDFARAAKQFSQDPTTLGQGGDLGYFPPYHADKDPIVRAAQALAVNQLSDVIQSEFGYHLVLLTGRKAGKPTKFADARNEVMTLLGDELRSSVIAEQRKHAKIELYGP